MYFITQTETQRLMKMKPRPRREFLASVECLCDHCGDIRTATSFWDEDKKEPLEHCRACTNKMIQAQQLKDFLNVLKNNDDIMQSIQRLANR